MVNAVVPLRTLCVLCGRWDAMDWGHRFVSGLTG
ncbi:hypothetical protein NOVOSPHI9U_430023 [Novosphingobium sp. 9U]|nr:hypothetical protein NOVOSPHI9U_430023 [Novosphingobium sp. 9U]